ncbi:thioredoxin H4-like [Solanum dulcamara]|uniref:thioredoxin H4-like n=1 Tax=Solanum dulcamara TaxID=45834 RepID=UPI002485EFB6|nr:thioredoxin H4-like [Solanum dulcamara]
MGANYSATLHESHNMPITPQFKRLHESHNMPITPQFKRLHEAHNMPITPQFKRTQVIAFHTSTKWKLHFDFLKDTNKLVLIDFTATWCGPCKYMESVLNDFAAKYTDVEFVKIDVDELADVAQEYGVQAMPTFVLIKKGKVVDKIVGADKDGLKMKIEKHRAMFI